MVMARTQTLVQLSDTLVSTLDEHAARLHRTRSDLIREALERYLADSSEAEIDRRIVAGYRRRPSKDIWGEGPAQRAIEAEPW